VVFSKTLVFFTWSRVAINLAFIAVPCCFD
jgi:hypothetical protein